MITKTLVKKNKQNAIIKESLFAIGYFRPRRRKINWNNTRRSTSEYIIQTSATPETLRDDLLMDHKHRSKLQ